jgi:hypothetical protein
MSSPEFKPSLRIPDSEIRISLLSLSLLVFGIFTDDAHDAFPTNDLTVVAQSLY